MALRLVLLREEETSERGKALACGARRGLLLLLVGLMYAVILSSMGFLLSLTAVRWMNPRKLFLRL